jgi:hypothetical protein
MFRSLQFASARVFFLEMCLTKHVVLAPAFYPEGGQVAGPLGETARRRGRIGSSVYYLRSLKDCQSRFLENGRASTYF